MAKISFIIINYFGYNDTINCINSILKHFISNFEIILIDNSNNESDYILLKEYYINHSNILIYKCENKGFGNASNIGVSYSTGSILFFLYNDTVINNCSNLNYLINLVLSQDYIVSPLVLNPDGTIQKNKGGFFNILSCIIYYLKFGNNFKNNLFVKFISRLFFYKNKTIQQYINSDNINLQSNSIDWVSGCALIISRNNFDDINGFDENYFMYFEDQDLCYQHSISGKKCISFNNLNLTHYIGKSNKTSNYNMELIKVKSMLYYANKNIKNGFILKTILFIISLPLSIFNPRIRYILKNYNSYE